MMGKYFYFIINKKSTLDHDLKKNSLLRSIHLRILNLPIFINRTIYIPNFNILT